MKHFLRGVLLVWIIVTYMIFAPNSDEQSIKKQIQQSGKTEIVFWHAMGGELGKVMDELISKYNAQSKDYYIKDVNMGGYDTLAKKILASLIANEAPDISQNYETLTKKFIKHQKIVCLDDLIEQDIANGEEDIRKDVVPVLLRNNTYEVDGKNKLYSFPFNKSIQVMYYNIDMFKEVGLPEKPPESFDELKQYCQQITYFYLAHNADLLEKLKINPDKSLPTNKEGLITIAKSVSDFYSKYNKTMFDKVGISTEIPQDETLLKTYCEKIIGYYKEHKIDDKGIYGYGCTKSNNWSFLNRLKANKGFIVKRNEKGVLESGFDTPAAIEALKFLQDILNEGIAKEAQGFDHQNDFVSGKVGIIEASVTSKVYMEGKIRFNFGLAGMPGSKNEDGSIYKSTILSGSNINIFNNGNPKKIAGAWDFVKWFTNTENGARWSEGTTYMPIRISSVNGEKIRGLISKQPEKYKAIYDSLENEKILTFEPRLTAWFEIRDMIADYLERATLERGDPAKYCKEMATDVNLILKHVDDNDSTLE